MGKFQLASKILAGLSGLLAIIMPFAIIPPAAVPYMGAAVAALMYAARWCEQQLPSTQVQAVTTAVAAGAVAVDGAVVTPPQVVVTDPAPKPAVETPVKT